MTSPRRYGTPAILLAASALVVTSALHGCAVGSEPELGVEEEDAGSVRLDGGGLPEPYRQDGAAPGEGGPGPGTPDAGDACAEALARITFGFDADDQGWTHGASDGAAGAWPYDPWTRGTASAGAACKSGSCFGAELTQNYAQCQRGFLLSPAIDLRACQGRSVALVFHHAYAFWTGTWAGKTWFDGGIVEVSADGTTWQVPPANGVYSGTLAINPNKNGTLSTYACDPAGFSADTKPGFVGAKPGTERIEIVLPASAIGASTRVRFSMASGVSSQTRDAVESRTATAMGWRIDDVGFVAK